MSGDLGRHGMAVMAARDGVTFESTIHSDCGYLGAPVLAMIEAGIALHCLRDLTRGGLASALNEVAAVSGLSMHLDEGRIRVREDVRGACEIFGLDPMYVANEGRFAAWLPEAHVARALEILRRFEISSGADRVGAVERADGRAAVTCRNAFGSTRVVDMLSGEQLPRIC